MLGYGYALPLSSLPKGGSTPPVDDWVIRDGTWNDAGTWHDNKTWNDEGDL